MPHVCEAIASRLHYFLIILLAIIIHHDISILPWQHCAGIYNDRMNQMKVWNDRMVFEKLGKGNTTLSAVFSLL